MNLFVLGPRALRDWISRMIETTRPEFTSSVPPLHLRLVDTQQGADAFVKSEASEEGDTQSVWFELPETPSGVHELPVLLELGAWTDSSARMRTAFAAAALAVHREAQASALHRVVAGPFAHDVRGALSVVSLSRQLLEAGAEGRSLGAKLRRVDSKVTAALFDLSARTRCLTGAWPPAEEDEDLLAPTVSSLLTWFSDAHPDRPCNVAEAARTQVERGPSWFPVALGGVLDGMARLSRGSLRVEVLSSEGRTSTVGLRISAETAALHPAQRAVLSRPDRWSLVSSELVPYRLATAALLVRSAGGTVEAKEEEGAYVITLALP